MRTGGTFMALAAVLALVGCALPPASEKLSLTPASFSDLDGWDQDEPLAALEAFARSCDVGAKGAGWVEACAAIPAVATDENARTYFEERFRPYAASGNAGDEGLFTGYYVPVLRGSLKRGGIYQTPLYARPRDMISVDLGAFKSDLKGQRIIGKVKGSRFVPYDDRAAVTAGSLGKRARVLVWIADPVDAFFVEVQGSGRVKLTDGRILPIGYDGTNGRAYVSLGRSLLDSGDLQRPVTMPAIRAWLAAHPVEAQAVMNRNPSYVFFKQLSTHDTIGAEGVVLTPGRSLAVDPAFVWLGTPLWLETTDAEGNALHRLMVAQDSGGAIKGPVRGDFFWGSGKRAVEEAGAMQSRGRYYLLLPKGANVE